MAYLDAIGASFRRRLIDMSALNAIIQSKVYPSYIAGVRDPKFPCICFNRLPSPLRDHRYTKKVTLDYDVWIWSKSNATEVDNIFELMTQAFDNEFFDLVGVPGRVGFKILDSGSQDRDSEHELYYCNFRVRAFAFFT